MVECRHEEDIDCCVRVFARGRTTTSDTCGAWTRVEGLGTSGRALALLPVKPGVGKGAAVEKCDRWLEDVQLWEEKIWYNLSQRTEKER